jgi:hypothetical protein
LSAAFAAAIPAIRDVTPVVRTIDTYLFNSLPSSIVAGRLFANLQQTGFVENLLNSFYYIGVTAARFDSVSHMVPAYLIDANNGLCSIYATTPVAGCSAHFGSSLPYTPPKAADRRASARATPAPTATTPAATTSPAATPATPGHAGAGRPAGAVRSRRVVAGHDLTRAAGRQAAHQQDPARHGRGHRLRAHAAPVGPPRQWAVQVTAGHPEATLPTHTLSGHRGRLSQVPSRAATLVRCSRLGKASRFGTQVSWSRSQLARPEWIVRIRSLSNGLSASSLYLGRKRLERAK